MDQLPEEIIDKTVAYLGLHPTEVEHVSQLRNFTTVAQISRLLNRIATPHLYRSVPLTVCKAIESLTVPIRSVQLAGAMDGFEPVPTFDIITTKGCNAWSFFKVLRRRRDLAEHVNCLTLLRDDGGFGSRLALGWYGYEKDSPVKLPWTEVEQAARTGVPLDSSRLTRSDPVKPVACLDEGFETVRALLRISSNLQQLDCSKYLTDALWNPAPEAFKSLRTRPIPQNDFSNLRSVKLHCADRFLARYWSIFILPNVHTIHLEAMNLCTPSPNDLDGWRSLRQCTVEDLQLQGLCIRQCDERIIGQDSADTLKDSGVEYTETFFPDGLNYPEAGPGSW